MSDAAAGTATDPEPFHVASLNVTDVEESWESDSPDGPMMVRRLAGDKALVAVYFRRSRSVVGVELQGVSGGRLGEVGEGAAGRRHQRFKLAQDGHDASGLCGVKRHRIPRARAGLPC